MATAVQELLKCFKWTVLKPLAYNNDLAYSNFDLSSVLNVHFPGQKFSSYDDVKTVLTRWLKSLDTIFYISGD